MKERKKENATNDNISPQADTLTDLPLAYEQADETKGGRTTNVDIIVTGGAGPTTHVK